MKRVYTFQTDTGSCHLYRSLFPAEFMGPDWEFTFGGVPNDIWDYDVVVGQRVAGENYWWNKICQNFKGLVIYDLDDDLIDVDPRNPVPYSIYEPMRDQTLRNIMSADVVTVSTHNLAAKLKPWADIIEVLPNCAHPSWIQRNEPRNLTVGWAGSVFHDMDLVDMPQILLEWEKFYRSIGGSLPVSFHSMGGNYFNGIGRHTPFQPLEYALPQMDFWVGLAPLLDCEFNQSKSWCKALEYACRGIPVIASNVGQYPDWLKMDYNGLLVKDRSEWIDALMTMADPEVRLIMSEGAMATAEQWTIDKKIHLWREVYERGKPR